MMRAPAVDLAHFTRALLDPALPCPPGLIARNGSDPSHRLAVHRNNMVVSLVEALADSFPVVRQLVGDEFFRAMAALFVRESPPTTPLLAQYGAHFPAYVERFAPARSVPYLADVARLELARVRAYHAADASVLSEGQIAAALATGEQIEHLRFVLHPSVSLVASDHSIVSIWLAHQGPSEPDALPIGGAEQALVLRRGGDEVVVLNLEEGDYAFLAAIVDGEPFGAAAASAQARSASFDLQSALALLLGNEALADIRHP